jgi:hypothetical protein
MRGIIEGALLSFILPLHLHKCVYSSSIVVVIVIVMVVVIVIVIVIVVVVYNHSRWFEPL